MEIKYTHCPSLFETKLITPNLRTRSTSQIKRFGGGAVGGGEVIPPHFVMNYFVKPRPLIVIANMIKLKYAQSKDTSRQ